MAEPLAADPDPLVLRPGRAGIVASALDGQGFEGRHAARSRLGRTLGIDEHFVMPGYGGRAAVDLVALLEAWRARFA